MKSLMVVTQLNDPFYIDYDREFAEYIISKAKSKGFMEEDVGVTELDANLVMQLFSPLVLSQWLLIDQTKEPCSSIVCPDGFLFAFKHTDDLLFIAVNGDGTESETFLHRKMQVFMTVMRFMFGPLSEELGLSSVNKKGKLDFLRLLMHNWSDLVHSEQAFLAEAIERVHVNQIVNEKCMEILLKSVKQFQVARDQPTHHALLLVNSKLLALYSNRNAPELHPKDVLLAMILAKTLHPETDRLEDLFSKFYISTADERESSLTADENSDAGDDEYHSAPNTPGGQRSRSPATSLKSETLKNIDSSDQDSQSEKSAEGITLLDMFRDKYPDVILSADHEKSGKKAIFKNQQKTEREHINVNTKNKSHTISIEALVHQVTDTKDMTLGLEISSHPVSVEGSSVSFQKQSDQFDVMSSIQQNGEQCNLIGNLTVYPADDKLKSSIDQNSEKNSSTVSSETEGGIDAPKSMTNNNVSLQYEQEDQSKIQNDANSTVIKNTVTPVPNGVYFHRKNESIQNLPGDRMSVEISSSSSSVLQTTSSDSQNVISSNLAVGNSIGQDTAAANQVSVPADITSSRRSSSADHSSKSRNSTPSQNSEPEMHSRTSSVVSNLSQSYPALSPQSERSFNFMTLLVNQSKEQLSRATSSRRITTVGNGKHSSISNTSRLNTESSSVTLETTNTYSVFSSNSSGDVYLPQTIFLETATCLYSPFSLHTVQISPGLTLMLFSQAPKHSLADSLYQVMHTVQDVVYGRRTKLPRSRSTYVYETINMQLGRIHGGLKKMKGRVRNLSYDVLARWEKEDFKQKLLDFLERDLSFRIPPELESSLVELYKKLRELFSHLFLSPAPYTSQVLDSLAQIRERIRTELMDYREYLNVKSQRNITMTSYIDEFPGLIHFIFIDRHFHQMTAPSMNISLKYGESMDATSYLKQKIWTMQQLMMTRLTEGYTTVMMRDGDFYFSYFLWFQDYTGNPLPVQESFKPSRRHSYPGILCGSFYKDLLQSCFPNAIQGSIHCNEMFLMHLGTVHPMYIAAQCRKLANRMWEMSGEIHNSISLL